MTTAADRRARWALVLLVAAAASCRKAAAPTSATPGTKQAQDLDAAEAELARTAAALRQLGVGAAPRRPAQPVASDDQISTGDENDGGGNGEPMPVTPQPPPPNPHATTEPEQPVAACQRICELADVACELEQRICGLADTHVGEARYENACYYARDQCELARDACDDCGRGC